MPLNSPPMLRRESFRISGFGAAKSPATPGAPVVAAVFSLLLLLLLLPVSDVAAAAPQDADWGDAVWQAQPRDRFVINTLIRRENRISFGDVRPEIQTVIDQLQLSYTVEQVYPSGAAQFRVEILAAARSVLLPGRNSTAPTAPTASTTTQKPAEKQRGQEPSNEEPSNEELPGSLASEPARDHESPQNNVPGGVAEASRISQLEGIRLTIEVAPDGIVEAVSFDDRNRLISNLAGLNQTTGRFLKESCSDETLAAWLSRPFWLAVPPGQMAAGQSWDRTDEISLGILGSTRLSVRIQAPDTLPEKFPAFLPLTLHGSGRFAPRLTTQEIQNSLPFQLTDLQVEVSDLAGTASFYDPGSSPVAENQRRPPFDQLHLAFRVHGSCQVETNGHSHPVTFEQHQSQNWFLVLWPTDSPLSNMPPQIRRRLRGLPQLPR